MRTNYFKSYFDKEMYKHMHIFSYIFSKKGQKKTNVIDKNFPDPVEEFNALIEIKRLENEKKELEKINQLKSNIAKFGFNSKIGRIEGSQLFTFINRNWYLNGNQIFEVIDKNNGDIFICYYFATENAFVDVFDSEKWYYNRNCKWEEQLNQYMVIPIFINY